MELFVPQRHVAEDAMAHAKTIRAINCASRDSSDTDEVEHALAIEQPTHALRTRAISQLLFTNKYSALCKPRIWFLFRPTLFPFDLETISLDQPFRLHLFQRSPQARRQLGMFFMEIWKSRHRFA